CPAVQRGNSTSRITVDVRCLRTLMANAGVERIDLLKFDIEGSESDVFRDAGVLASVGALVGEVHPDLMSLSRSAFMRQFAGFDTTCEPLADGRFMLRAVAVTAA
ncbi:MAG: FkbM family methyltransferase, partial [Pseudomonadota bacterium]